MPSTSENTSAGLASTATKILDLMSFVMGNGVLSASCEPHGMWRGKWYAVFVNGRYMGQQYCPIKGTWEFSTILDEGTELASFCVVEAGEWASYDDDDSIPKGWIEEWDAQTSKRVRITWDSEYTDQGLTGSTQLTSILTDGFVRWSNCQQGDLPTRGRVYMSIVTSGTTHRIDWWAAGQMVASGYRDGDGVVTCSEVNDSGLTISGILAYTGDIALGDAFYEVCFPSSFQVHYSTSPLSYPREPEAYVYDDGSATNFTYLSPVLTGSTYHYNVLAVGDNGEPQASTSPPADSPISLNQAPMGCTITGVSGTWDAPVVTWTYGEDGCYATLYHSYPNQPINLGEWESPVELVTGIGDASQQLPPVVDWAPEDRQPYIDALMSSFDSAIADLSTAFGVGSTGFGTAWDAAYVAMQDAVREFGSDIEWNVTPFMATLERIDFGMRGMIAQSLGYSEPTVWSSVMGSQLALLYQDLGLLVYDEPNRWRLDGYDPLDGQTYVQPGDTVVSLVSLCDPIVRPARVCVIVRATKASTGIQETEDRQFCFEIDENGDVVPLKPNECTIDGWTNVGKKLTVKALYLVADEEASPTHVDLYVVPTGTTIDPTTPTTSSTLGSEVLGERRKTVSYTVAANGFYDIAVIARVASTGARSDTYRVRTIMIDDSAPDGVINLKAQILRGNQ